MVFEAGNIRILHAKRDCSLKSSRYDTNANLPLKKLSMFLSVLEFFCLLIPKEIFSKIPSYGKPATGATLHYESCCCLVKFTAFFAFIRSLFKMEKLYFFNLYIIQDFKKSNNSSKKANIFMKFETKAHQKIIDNQQF